MALNYYSDWETHTWSCECGWNGAGGDAWTELHDALVQVDCPECGSRLFLVDLPTPDQVRAAAAVGNEEAQKELGPLRQAEERWAHIDAQPGFDPSVLPDAVDGRIELELTTVSEADGGHKETWMALFHDSRELYRELAQYETLSPLRRLLPAFRERYGDAEISLHTTYSAFIYLLGDRTSMIDDYGSLLKQYDIEDIKAAP